MNSATKRKIAERNGRRAEFMAALWLNLKWYRVLGRRVRTPAGELDIVALSPRGVLSIVEVKARKAAVEALEAVSFRQRERIVRAAKLYLSTHPALRHNPVRFDAILIVPYRLPRHVKDAWRL
jgi:putative endonuclease